MSNGGATAQPINRERWTQLIAGIICMIMIANLQYGWTLFVHPINKAHGWSVTDIQVAFSIFVALETWLTPIEGWLGDYLGPTRGPRVLIAIGGLLVALGWIINGEANSLGVRFCEKAEDQQLAARERHQCQQYLRHKRERTRACRNEQSGLAE